MSEWSSFASLIMTYNKKYTSHCDSVPIYPHVLWNSAWFWYTCPSGISILFSSIIPWVVLNSYRADSSLLDLRILPSMCPVPSPFQTDTPIKHGIANFEEHFSHNPSFLIKYLQFLIHQTVFCFPACYFLCPEHVSGFPSHFLFLPKY